MKLKIGHTPDPDDAFMFYGLATGAVRIEGFEPEFILEDIQSLNLRARGEELDVTAISAAAYPGVADRYQVLSVGASVGRGYGPIVVGRPGSGFPPFQKGLRADLQGRRVAIPGKETTAALLLSFYAEGFVPAETPFDRVLPSVASGETELGLVIHEGQMTYHDHGLKKLADLGALWEEDLALPIPLGLDVVKRNLGGDAGLAVDKALRESILYALSHESEATDYALQFGRGLEPGLGNRFIKMYVNEDTLKLPPDAQAALLTLFQRAAELSLTPPLKELDIVEAR